MDTDKALRNALNLDQVECEAAFFMDKAATHRLLCPVLVYRFGAKTRDQRIFFEITETNTHQQLQE